MALLVLIPPIAQAIAAAATAVIGMAIGIVGGQVAIDEGKKANAEADKTLSKQSPTATGECPPGIGHNGGPPLDEAPVGEAPPAEAPPAPTNPAAGPSGSDPKPNNSNPDNPTAGGPAGQPSGAPAFTNSAEDRARQGREKLKRDAEESGHGGFGTRSPKEDPKKKNGRWDGDRGNSGWSSNDPRINAITGGAPIQFHDGYPDFSPYAVYRVDIGQFRNARAFSQ